MDIKRPLRIGYAGSLAWSDGQRKLLRGSLRDYFWTYQNHVTDPSTRSAYFLFKAVAMAKNVFGVTPQDLQIELWGNIDSRNVVQAKDLGIESFVRIDGYVSKRDSIARSNSCDILFLPMESPSYDGEPLFIPGKAFEYMNARKPILALAPECDCVRILRPSGLLAQFDPREEERIAKWIAEVIPNRQLLESYRPDDAYIEKYSFTNITSKLAEVFNEVLHKEKT